MSNDEHSGRSDTAEIERIRARIEKLVSEHFGRGEEIYYLSQLGNDLGTDLKALERMSGMRLGQFLANTFEFTIEHSGVHKNVLYIRRSDSGTGSLPIPTPRYKKRFWTAFATSLEGAERRLINLATLKFGSDHEDVGEGGGDVRSIDPKYITADGEYVTSSEILGRIKEWLAEQHLEQERFTVATRNATKANDARSLLDALMNSLSGEQLKRINLPLDVIKILNGRRIG